MLDRLMGSIDLAAIERARQVAIMVPLALPCFLREVPLSARSLPLRHET